MRLAGWTSAAASAALCLLAVQPGVHASLPRQYVDAAIDLARHPESAQSQSSSFRGVGSLAFPSSASADGELGAADYDEGDASTTSDEGGSKFYPIKPPSIPLAVKGPYLNAWAPAGQLLSATPPNRVGNGGYLAGQDAAFWTSSYGADGGYRLGWRGFIRIDNTTYQWMGDSFGKLVRQGKNARQLSLTYTSTRSIFELEADGVRFKVTFLTPVWPNDYLRQSIPMSYMHVSLDRDSARKRSVQFFTDIDERWCSGHSFDYETYPMDMLWVDNIHQSKHNNSAYFVQRKNPQPLTEFRQRAEWGSAVYAMRKRPGMSSRNHNNVVAHREFINTGNVTYDHGPTAGPDNSYGYTVNFDVMEGGDDALFGIGHVRSPYVNYIQSYNGSKTTSYLQNRFGYWMSKYPNFQDLVGFFMADFENALEHSIKLDEQIDRDSQDAVGGGRIGEMYSAITQLSVRQSFATIETTIPYIVEKDKYDETDPITFLKEISSNGDMSTVDVFAPQFPLLTYLNPEILRDLMRPIFNYTESGLYPNRWCVHDLGVYPSAFGHNDGNDEPMQVEESGNMILLALHYAQLTDPSRAKPWLRKHYKIMRQWTDFLVADSLVPALQLSTDDFAGTLANQSDLAIKGILGIAAMGQIADMLDEHKDARNLKNVSEVYAQKFYEYAIANNDTHVKLSYQENDSWGTLYNLVFDRLLNLGVVSKELYLMQDRFYPTKAEKYGVPLDSRFSWAKTDWQMWASASAANITTRDMWIEHLYRFVSNGKTDAPFTDLYETKTGDFPKEPRTPRVRFIARPVVGGHFMHLAVAKANKANGISEYRYGPPINRTTKASPEQVSQKEESKDSKWWKLGKATYVEGLVTQGESSSSWLGGLSIQRPFGAMR